MPPTALCLFGKPVFSLAFSLISGFLVILPEKMCGDLERAPSVTLFIRSGPMPRLAGFLPLLLEMDTRRV